ncbi:uncharacterized protein METZ01_LOCUS250911, partial [marine metagenome]
ARRCWPRPSCCTTPSGGPNGRKPNGIV